MFCYKSSFFLFQKSSMRGDFPFKKGCIDPEFFGRNEGRGEKEMCTSLNRVKLNGI